MPRPATRTRSDGSRSERHPPWSPVFAYNNLPPIPSEQLTTPGVEARCKLATAALRTLRDATTRFSDAETVFQTVALVEAQASSAIEGIVSTVSRMLEHLGKPNLSKGSDPDADDALRHLKSIIDAWQRRGTEPVGTAMAIRACSTTKGRRMPVRRGHGTVIAGARGIIYTPPTGEKRIRSMLDELWRFMHEDEDTDPLVRMAAGHHQFESIHPFADGNSRTGRLINALYVSERKLTDVPVLCHSATSSGTARPTTDCWTRRGRAATGSRGPCGWSTACGKRPSGSQPPWNTRRPQVNEPLRRTERQGPGQPPATPRSGSCAAGSAAGPRT